MTHTVPLQMCRFGYVVCLGGLLVSGLSPRTAWAGSEDSLFTVPPALQEVVGFWRDVFATYSVHDIALHHRDYPEIVYAVVSLPPPAGTTEVPARQRREAIEEHREGIDRVLERLQAGARELTDEELRIRALFRNVPGDNKFQEARQTIRAQRGLKEKFRQGLARQGRYLEYIQQALQEEGIPRALAALPHVESSFDYQAYSRAHAAGIWQFTRSTGRLYLRIASDVDERRDPITSTHAAARLLRHNYDELGAWPLAILAYNHGTGGVKRAVQRTGSRDIVTILQTYHSRIFGFASRNFYPEFLAALEIMRNYRSYFGDVAFEEPVQFDQYTVERSMPAPDLLRELGADPEAFKALNLGLSSAVVNGRRPLRAGQTVKLPVSPGGREVATEAEPPAAVASLMVAQTSPVSPQREVGAEAGTLDVPASDPAALVVERGEAGHWVTVQPDETLWHYARWAGSSIEAIRQVNGLRRGVAVQLRQRVRVPLSAESAAAFEAQRAAHHTGLEEAFFRRHRVVDTAVHRVGRGDNLWDLCHQQYDLPMWLLVRYNQALERASLKVGDILIIPVLERIS